MTLLRTLVVDDSAAMREAVSDALRAVCGCFVVGQGANGQEAVALARALRPSLVVMDVCMPLMGGLEAMRLLKQEMPCTQVVLLSTILEPEIREEALHSGAIACLEKSGDLWVKLPAIVRQLSQTAQGDAASAEDERR